MANKKCSNRIDRLSFFLCYHQAALTITPQMMHGLAIYPVPRIADQLKNLAVLKNGHNSHPEGLHHERHDYPIS